MRFRKETAVATDFRIIHHNEVKVGIQLDRDFDIVTIFWCSDSILDVLNVLAMLSYAKIAKISLKYLKDDRY